MAAGWTTERSEFMSREGQKLPLNHVVQTDTGVHPTSFLMDTGDSFSEEKTAEAN
jgi:hypothetical protein